MVDNGDGDYGAQHMPELGEDLIGLHSPRPITEPLSIVNWLGSQALVQLIRVEAMAIQVRYSKDKVHRLSQQKIIINVIIWLNCRYL